MLDERTHCVIPKDLDEYTFEKGRGRGKHFVRVACVDLSHTFSSEMDRGVDRMDPSRALELRRQQSSQQSFSDKRTIEEKPKKSKTFCVMID